MLNNAIQQNTQLCVQNAKQMVANREYRRESIQPVAMKTKIFEMTHPEWYCGRAKVLDIFLDTIRSNFQSHAQLFPHGDPDTVKYTVRHLSTWNNHLNPAQRQTQMTNPVEWLRDLWRHSDPCLEVVEAFWEEMHNMYGDKDGKLKTAMKCMTEFLKGANEPVRVYTNQIKANWRAARWLQQDNKYHYEIAWSRLQAGLKSKIKPLTPKIGKFDSMEELFDCAANSEVKLDGKTPQLQQPHQQQKQSGESSQQYGTKCNFRPSISEPAEVPKPDKSKADNNDKRTPAQWHSPELYTT